MSHQIHPNILNCPTIIIAGAGGTGGALIAHLARINIALIALGGNGFAVELFDSDHVSQSNVGRQPFLGSDVGLNKATTLITRINAAYGFHWKAHPCFLDSRTRPNHSAIIISCVDTVKARRDIHKIAKKNKSYWLDCGNSKNTGQVILGSFIGNKDDMPCIFDIFPDMEADEKPTEPSCSLEEALLSQDITINQAVAMAASDLIYSIFRKPTLEVHGAFIRTQPIQIQPLKLTA